MHSMKKIINKGDFNYDPPVDRSKLPYGPGKYPAVSVDMYKKMLEALKGEGRNAPLTIRPPAGDKRPPIINWLDIELEDKDD